AGAAPRRRVLVVGAGPGGLQTAIAAAARGHEVTVVERETVAGGQVRWAASVPNRAELGDVVRNQLTECADLGVVIEYGVTADADCVSARRPDVVVVATGSRPVRPWWAPPADTPAGSRVVDVLEVLRGDAEPTGDVLVVDQLGFHQATSVAELLADRGCRVEIVTPSMVVGQDLGVTLDQETWWIRAAAKGIVSSTDRIVNAVNPDGEVHLMHHPTGATETRRPDWVVTVLPYAPADELYHELRRRADEEGIEVHRVGDAVAPRRIHAAVVDGDRIGAGL
ncbi:MAG: FAD-binding protein, partial [Actinomyces sp.]